MPGLTLCLTADISNGIERRFRDLQSLMLHSRDYKAVIDVCSPGLIVGHVGYPDYPVRVIRFGAYLVAFEGRIYGQESGSVERELRKLVEDIDIHPEAREQLIKQWILDSDGEYLIAIADTAAKDLMIFNDPLGRLPFVYFANDKQLIAGREDKFVARFAGVGLDRLGAAQTLWLGYALGTRTLFESVKRLPAASLLAAKVSGPEISTRVATLFQSNFEERDLSRKCDAVVTELVDLFLSATRSRGCGPDAGLNVISLSGGQDSRAVAVAMRRENASCVAATFATPSGYGSEDVHLAELISKKLKIPWHFIPVPDGDAVQQQRLVSMTDGHNLVTMTFILAFMDVIVARWGRTATYVTGDGGDKIFPGALPRRPVVNLDALVKYVIEEHAILPLQIVEQIFHLDAGLLVAELRDLLLSYPERDWGHKSVHYTIYERGHNWLFEGEDRARFFLWQTTPFYSFPLFQHAMQVPDALKSNNRLYCAFQKKLHPEVAAIPDATYGVAPNSWVFPWRVRLLSYCLRVPPNARHKLLAVLGRSRRTQLPQTIVDSVSEHGMMDACVVRKMLKTATTRGVRCWQTLTLLEALWAEPSRPSISPESLLAPSA